MKSISVIIMFHLLFTTTTSFGGKQQLPDRSQITADEERDARKFAEDFWEKLQQTRNLKPFLEEAFLNKDVEGAFLDYLTGKFIPKHLRSDISRDDLRCFVFAQTSLHYLSELHIYSQYSFRKDSVKDLKPSQKYPKDVAELLANNPTISSWWKEVEEKGFTEKKISTTEQFSSVLTAWELAVSLMREQYKLQRPERTKMFLDNISYLKDDIMKPNIIIEQVGIGYPVGTRYISISVPTLHLLLLRSDRQIKLVLVGPQPD